MGELDFVSRVNPKRVTMNDYYNGNDRGGDWEDCGKHNATRRSIAIAKVTFFFNLKSAILKNFSKISEKFRKNKIFRKFSKQYFGKK